LLESIVGLDFLPRGSGVVTRRPLELRLVHTPNRNKKPFAVFENQKNLHYTDMRKVCEQIAFLTNEVAGSKKGIIDDPIVMTIFGEDCPDLTIIDLPGITRVPLF